MQDTEVVLNVKPTYNFMYLAAPTFIIFGIMIIFIMLVICIVNVKVALIAGLVMFLFIALCESIYAIFEKKQMSAFNYDFYRTKIVYKDSFLNISEKQLKYKHIREVTLRQTFFQRCFNMGTIILYTSAETGAGSGVLLANIYNPKEVYNNIKDVIDID